MTTPGPAVRRSEVDLSSPGRGSLQLTTHQTGAEDTARGVIPAAAWDDVNASYEQWKAAYQPPR